MAEMNSTTESTALSGKILFRQECVFWCTAAVLLFLFLWSPFHWEKEVIHAEITREMLVSGNWFHPALNWQVFPEKPVLGFWATLPFVKLLGFSEFAVRLPSVLAALGALYVLRLLGRRLFSEKVSSIGCWLFLSSAGFLLWGRNAGTDMFNTLAVLLAVNCFFKLAEKPSFTGYTCFYLLCFGGALFNDLRTLFTPLLLVGPLVLQQKMWKVLWNRDHLFAFLLCLTFYVFYFYVTQSLPFGAGQISAAQIAPNFPELLWSDFAKAYRRLVFFPGSWYSCWREMLLFLLPWTPVLPVGIAGLLKNWKNLSPTIRTLFLSVCGTFIIYTVLGTRSFGATLPLLPFLLLFCAAGFGGKGVAAWNQHALNTAYYFCITAASFCVCSIITYPLWEKIADYTPPAALVLGPVAAGVLSWLLLFMDHRANSSITRLIGLPHRMGSTLLAGTILSGAALTVVFPVVSQEFDTEKRFFQELHRQLSDKGSKTGKTAVASFGSPIPPAYLFYNALTTPVPTVDDLELLVRKNPGKQVAVLMKKRKELQARFNAQCKKYKVYSGKPFLTEKVLRWRAPDSRNDNFVACLITLPGGKTSLESDRSTHRTQY